MVLSNKNEIYQFKNKSLIPSLKNHVQNGWFANKNDFGQIQFALLAYLVFSFHFKFVRQ